MAVCLSHSGVSIHASKQPSNKLYVGTVEGVFTLEREGKDGAWRPAHQGLAGYHVCALALDPDNEFMIAGTHNGGVAISEDGGKSWRFANEGIHSENVFAVAISRVDGKTVLYAGTEPAHLYRSEDLGKTWTELPGLRSVPNVKDWTFPPPPNLAHVKHVAFDPHNPTCLYVSVEQGEMLRSPDGGTTWEDLLSRAGVVREAEGDAHRAVIAPSRPDEIFLPTGFGLFFSSDRGKTWRNMKDALPWIGYPAPMVFDPYRENLMFAAGATNNPGFWIESKNANARVARSRDGGRTWELTDQTLPKEMKASIEAMVIEGWGDGCAVYLGTTDGEVYCSTDDGETWEKIAENLPPISKGVHYLLAKGLTGGPPPGHHG